MIKNKRTVRAKQVLTCLIAFIAAANQSQVLRAADHDTASGGHIYAFISDIPR